MEHLQAWAIALLLPVVIGWAFKYIAGNSEKAARFAVKWLLAHPAAGKILLDHLGEINEAIDNFQKGLAEEVEAEKQEPPKA